MSTILGTQNVINGKGRKEGNTSSRQCPSFACREVEVFERKTVSRDRLISNGRDREATPHSLG